MRCDTAEAICRETMSLTAEKHARVDVVQASGQLKAHYGGMCPCHGYPPVDTPVLPRSEPVKEIKEKKARTHGAAGYRYGGCRCEICIEGIRAERRKYRKRSDACRLRFSATPLIERLEKDGRMAAIANSIVHRWKREGMDVYGVDRWCIRFGYHPVEIYGQEFYRGIEPYAPE